RGGRCARGRVRGRVRPHTHARWSDADGGRGDGTPRARQVPDRRVDASGGRAASGAVDSVSRREYPDVPRVGVGAVVLSRDRVLLGRRGGQPSSGKWSLPGGGLELGETTVAGIHRELAEECGLRIRVAGLAGVLDRVVKDAEGRVRYHWVLVD